MSRTPWSPPPLSREHGAWVMIVIPLVLGLVLAGPRPSAAWAVPPAALLAFLAHGACSPLLQRIRAGKPAPAGWLARRIGWGTFYLLGASLAVVLAFAGTPAAQRSAFVRLGLIWYAGGGLYGAASAMGGGRVLAAELMVMATVTLSAPLMALAAGRPASGELIAAPLLAFAYFTSSVAAVRAYVRRAESRWVGRRCIAVHLVLLAALGLLSWLGRLPPWWIVPMLPPLARTVWVLVRPPRNLRLLGRREAWVATAFTLLTIAILVL